MARTILLICLVAAVVALATAQTFNDIVSRLTSNREVDHCPIDNDTAVISCKNAKGFPVETAIGRLPLETECKVRIDGARMSTIVCLKNGIKLKTKRVLTQGAAVRVKRSFWRKVGNFVGHAASGLLSVVGGVYGGPIGAAVGGIAGNLICLFICSSDSGPPPNSPPTLQCPKLQMSNPVSPSRGETKAMVSWTNPVAKDPEDGNLNVAVSPDNFKSGTKYAEGWYAVGFYAHDRKGSGTQCSLSFHVKVKRCPHPGWPRNGDLICSLPTTTVGDVCHAKCDAGYEVKTGSTSSLECTESETWDHRLPQCIAMACKTKPTVNNGNINCPNGEVYNKLCGVVCEDGYSISGGYFVQCNEKGQWPTAIPQCKDTTPPKFHLCPGPIQADIDSANNTAYVTWQEPSGSDNSGKFIIKEKNGKTVGRFKAGQHIIIYQITDEAGNEGQSCLFTIHVQTINCDPPAINVKGKEYLSYTCPDFYRLGAECSLSCEAGYPFVGVDKIKCSNKGDSNPPDLQWTWDQHGLTPYCKVSTCSDLAKPANGALACAQWLLGNTCTMQCQSGFDVPFTRKDGTYVCSTTNGMWLPNPDVPDCIKRRPNENLKMAADFFYYNGTCGGSNATMNHIQHNFIAALNSSRYNALCTGYNECQSRFVSVECGPVPHGRRRRDEHQGMVRRSASQAYKVTFELVVVSFIVGSKTATKAVKDTEDVLTNMFDVIQTEVDAGKFNIPGLEIKDDSLGVGFAEMDCPEGMEARLATASCAGCGYGRYYSSKTSHCEMCPIGTYQDKPHDIDCIKCPNNTTTLSTGTKNSTDCLRYCEAGEYSATGLAPCGQCPSNKYQPNSRQTNCSSCPDRKRSSGMGATRQDQCEDYDIQMAAGKEVISETIKATSAAFSVATWLSMMSTTGQQTLFSLVSADHTFKLSLKYNLQVIVDINGVEEMTGITFNAHAWSHAVLNIDSTLNTITIFVNGKEAHTSTSFTIQRGVTTGDKVVINADMQLSDFQLSTTLLTKTDLHLRPTTCHVPTTNTVLSIDNLAKSQNAKSVVPSKCDAQDECESNPCDHQGVCTNLQTGFECSCSNGYTGDSCQNKPDPCLSSVCQNGATCHAMASNYSCICPYGFKGDACDEKAVDGKWSVWNEWTDCSKDCGGGVSNRSRACNSPPADPEGKPCVGNTIETRDCNVQIICPECLRLRRPRGASAVLCNETNTLKRCHIECQEGYQLPIDSPPYYDCGALTEYRWTHQTNDNPKARLPACSELKVPDSVAISTTTEYASLTCQNDADVMASMKQKLGTMPCATAVGCDNIVTSNCNSHTRKKRSTSSLEITINIHAGNLPTDVDVKELFQNNTADARLLDFIQAIYNVESTAQQMFNKTNDFFNVSIAGIKYGPTNLLNLTSNVTCQSGSVRLSALCIKSPIGSYSDGTSIVMCPKDTYQDTTGSSKCKPCPVEQTTLEIGAESVDECSVPKNDPTHGKGHSSSAESSDNSNTAVVVGSAIGGIIVLAGIALGVLMGYKIATKGKRQVGRSCDDLHKYGDGSMDHVSNPKFNPDLLDDCRPATASKIHFH